MEKSNSNFEKIPFVSLQVKVFDNIFSLWHVHIKYLATSIYSRTNMKLRHAFYKNINGNSLEVFQKSKWEEARFVFLSFVLHITVHIQNSKLPFLFSSFSTKVTSVKKHMWNTFHTSWIYFNFKMLFEKQKTQNCPWTWNSIQNVWKFANAQHLSSPGCFFIWTYGFIKKNIKPNLTCWCHENIVFERFHKKAQTKSLFLVLHIVKIVEVKEKKVCFQKSKFQTLKTIAIGCWNLRIFETLFQRSCRGSVTVKIYIYNEPI